MSERIAREHCPVQGEDGHVWSWLVDDDTHDLECLSCDVKVVLALLPEEREPDEESLCKTCGDSRAEVCLGCARRGMTDE
jgi:hypothetical protein